MKKFFCLIMICVLCLCFTGCLEVSNEPDNNYSESDASREAEEEIVLEETIFNDRFECLKTDSSSAYISGNYVFIDNKTGVMYLIVKSNDSVAVTVMVDTDGKPLIYDPEESVDEKTEIVQEQTLKP